MNVKSDIHCFAFSEALTKVKHNQLYFKHYIKQQFKKEILLLTRLQNMDQRGNYQFAKL